LTVPLTARRDPWLQRIREATAFVFLTMGAGYTFGPDQWRSSPSFAVVKQAMGLRAWGYVFLAIGIAQAVALLWRRFDLLRLALIVGAGITAAWAVSFVAAALIGKLTGASAPALWGFFSMVQITQAGRVRRNH
jgi:hypothetical protein